MRRSTRRRPFEGSALLTHIHWDHVQGLPFFTPVLQPGAQFDVYGPPQPDEGSLESAFNELMRPPFFPVTTAELLGDIRFHDVWEADLELDGGEGEGAPGAPRRADQRLPHRDGRRSVAYLSRPPDAARRQPAASSDAVLELCDGVDLLIHDAQYTAEEFPAKATWGHCTVDYAVHVAQESGAARLALFHHDPTHDDDTVDAILAHAQASPRAAGSLRSWPPRRAWSSASRSAGRPPACEGRAGTGYLRSMSAPAPFDSAKYRQVLGHFPTGVTVITAATDGEPVGMAVGSFSSVSLDPPLVAFFPDKGSSSWPKIEPTGSFCVNILGEAQEDVCRRFAMKGDDKFAGLGWSAVGQRIAAARWRARLDRLRHRVGHRGR